MCGICGETYLSPSGVTDPARIERMIAQLGHRGPDETGLYAKGPTSLGHTRLSIIDVGGGTQPIANEDNTIWVVFNGEIYNYPELRKELRSQGHHFKTDTDTEVLPHLYEEHGEAFLSKLRGMFAFALWDERRRVLLIARDRVGIKPLYYSVSDKTIAFASEIKALRALPGIVEPGINMNAMATFLTCYYGAGSETLIQGIHKLPPGHTLTVADGRVAIREYWDLTFTDRRRVASRADQEDELRALLDSTVRDHLISDVPVGVLLSGGVDSTGILSFASEHASSPLKTFTVGFEGGAFHDERAYARVAAERFGTEHYETIMSSNDFRDALPTYVLHMEEPVCEAPALALYHVSRLARQHVKVVLSGEGGDEAFAGYHTYRNLIWLMRLKQALGPLRGPLACALAHGTPGHAAIRKYLPLLETPLPDYYHSRTANPANVFGAVLPDMFTDDFHHHLSQTTPRAQFAEHFARVRSLPLLHQLLYVDSKTWLPDDLLVKADKMTMANSLELRVPLLDHRVLEFAARVPAQYKVRGTTTKYLLKKILSSRVPPELLRRKKMGFTMPYSTWLQHDLADYVSDVLLDTRTIQRGYFHRSAVERLLVNHRESGRHTREVFALLVLELWHRTFADALPLPHPPD